VTARAVEAPVRGQEVEEPTDQPAANAVRTNLDVKDPAAFTKDIIEREKKYGEQCLLQKCLASCPGLQCHTLLCRYVLQTYVRPDIVFTHAEGVRMWDAHGKEYLDFAAGIAVNSVGESVSKILIPCAQFLTKHQRPGPLCLPTGSCAFAGHSHPRWLAAVNEQAAVLTHTSNLFHTEAGVRSSIHCIHSIMHACN